MARSLNRVTLIGNLGSDPELRATPQGTSVCTLRIATTESYKDRNGEMKESTEWHNVVLWEKLAEIANTYLKKGSKIYIEGRLKTRSYEKDSITRYVTETVAQNLIMLGGRSDGDASKSHEYGGSATEHLPADSMAIDDDDVPF